VPVRIGPGGSQARQMAEVGFGSEKPPTQYAVPLPETEVPGHTFRSKSIRKKTLAGHRMTQYACLGVSLREYADACLRKSQIWEREPKLGALEDPWFRGNEPGVLFTKRPVRSKSHNVVAWVGVLRDPSRFFASRNDQDAKMARTGSDGAATSPFSPSLAPLLWYSAEHMTR